MFRVVVVMSAEKPKIVTAEPTAGSIPLRSKPPHQRVWELYGQGASTKAIAEDTGYCITHVRRILQGKFKYEPE